jgi:hypothetical protein
MQQQLRSAPPRAGAAPHAHRAPAPPARCSAVAAAPRPSRRAALVAAPLLLALAPRRARASELVVDSDTPGFGARPAAEGDLVLIHYVGTLAATGAVFDSTRGGAVVRTSGASVSISPAEAAPRVLSLRAGDAQPGACAGLRAALLGMRVGGTRTVTVPPELGFGQVTWRGAQRGAAQRAWRPLWGFPPPRRCISAHARSRPPAQTAVGAPYATVPAGSTLRYDIQLLRLSSAGPDALLAGVAQCGVGGAGAQLSGCAAVEPAE